MKKKIIFKALFIAVVLELFVIIGLKGYEIIMDSLNVNKTVKISASSETKKEKPLSEIKEASEIIDNVTPEDNEKSYAPVKVDDSYFDDALFIGDSRTVGLRSFCDFHNSYFFAKTGISTNALFTYSDRDETTGLTLSQVLVARQYKKIYIMLGINDLAYGTAVSFTDEFFEAVDKIREYQPNAIIYIQSIIGVTKYKEQSAPNTFSNATVLARNALLKSKCDGKTLIYLDLASVFSDSEGYLDTLYSADGLHLISDYYNMWCEYLRNNALPES